MSRRLRRVSLLLALVIVFSPQSPAQATSYTADGFRFIGGRCSWGWHGITNEWGYPGIQTVGTMDRSYAGYCDDTGWQADPTRSGLRKT